MPSLWRSRNCIPEVNSVVELGGQDAKIIVFKDDDSSGRKKKIPTMNDKCAGGTGAVIDKIVAKLKIPSEQLCNQGYAGIKLHQVAGKCGVFAETDINGLQKQGVPADQLMASLFDAIVLQNLTVLTRGNTLRPHVLLLGGPNSFIRGMREAWQHNIPRVWKERGLEIAEGDRPEDLIKVPEDAVYFAAIGAVEFGRAEDEAIGRYLGTECLEHYLQEGRQAEKAKAGSRALWASAAELQDSRQNMQVSPLLRQPFSREKWFAHSSVWMAVPPQPRRFCCRRAETCCARPTSFLRAIRLKTRSNFLTLSASRWSRRERPRSAWCRHNRLCQGYPARCAARRCGAGGDSSPYPIGVALLSRSPLHRRRGRAGHQDHRPA